jgi:hypothetical protein
MMDSEFPFRDQLVTTYQIDQICINSGFLHGHMDQSCQTTLLAFGQGFWDFLAVVRFRPRGMEVQRGETAGRMASPSFEAVLPLDSRKFGSC